jgi:hypothetical protein
VIFKSDGAESLEVLSIASSYPLPKVVKGVAAAVAATSAALLRNDLLEDDIF